MGALIGLVAATFATLAMVRRPPWPDLHGTVVGLQVAPCSRATTRATAASRSTAAPGSTAMARAGAPSRRSRPESARRRDHRISGIAAGREQPDLVVAVVADVEADQDQHRAANSIDVGQDSPHPVDQCGAGQRDRDRQRADDQREAGGVGRIDPDPACTPMCRRRRRRSPPGTGRRCRTARRSHTPRRSRTSSRACASAPMKPLRANRFGSDSDSSRPASSQIPSATSAMPMSTVT